MRKRGEKIRSYGSIFLFVFLLGCQTAKNDSPPAGLRTRHAGLRIIDAHNHDAANGRYRISRALWDRYGIDAVVLFGNISEPAALRTDAIAYDAYREDPDTFIPFIAAINIFDPSCLDYIAERFRSGVFGIGEIVAASQFSPMTSALPWKGKDALDGYLPQIYELCAEYGRPILLHIDPPDDRQIGVLLEAAALYPETDFILAHANAYTTPLILARILKESPNVYLDFFAGFTVCNHDCPLSLKDFVPLMKAHPDRFVVSSDSGYGIGYDKAYAAMTELLDLLDRNTAMKVASENIMRLTGFPAGRRSAGGHE